MTILFALRADMTAEMLEYDLDPEEAARVMMDEIGGDVIRAVYDITDGEPRFIAEEPWEHYLQRIGTD